MKAENILRDLKSLANPKKAKHSMRFFKSGPGEYGEGDNFLGITVPSQRKVAKKYRELPPDEAGKLLQNKYHEVRLTTAMLLVYKVETCDMQVLQEVVDCYLENLSGINNWD